MKHFTLIFCICISISIFSQEETVIEKLVLKNQKLISQNDSLKEQKKSLNNQNKELLNKIENQSSELEKLKVENKEIKTELNDIKKISYSKQEYNDAIFLKDIEIQNLKKKLLEKEKQFQNEKIKLEEKNITTLSILSDMNQTFFEKKIKDIYNLQFIKDHPFKTEDSLNFRKYDAMIISLNADPSIVELKSNKILDKATKFNEVYFDLYEAYSTFDNAYDSSNVNKALIKIIALKIPVEYEGLNKSKNEIISLLNNYCNIQSEIFQQLKKTDNIIDKNYLTSQLDKVSKSEKYKHYKYLREIIEKYAKNKIELPVTNCTQKR